MFGFGGRKVQFFSGKDWVFREWTSVSLWSYPVLKNRKEKYFENRKEKYILTCSLASHWHEYVISWFIKAVTMRMTMAVCGQWVPRSWPTISPMSLCCLGSKTHTSPVNRAQLICTHPLSSHTTLSWHQFKTSDCLTEPYRAAKQNCTHIADPVSVCLMVWGLSVSGF